MRSKLVDMTFRLTVGLPSGCGDRPLRERPKWGAFFVESHLEFLRKDEEFVLYRGRNSINTLIPAAAGSQSRFSR